MNKRIQLKLLIDTSVWFAAGLMAYMLRLEHGLWGLSREIWMINIYALPLKFLLCYIFGHHRVAWRYAYITDFKGPFFSVMVYTFIYFFVAAAFRDFVFIPLSVPAIEALLAIIGFTIIRVAARYFYRERRTAYNRKNGSDSFKRVLIVGAGEAGTMIAREMERHAEMRLRPVGYLDDSDYKQKQIIQGLQVFGRIEDLTATVKEKLIDEVIISMPSESGAVIRRVVGEVQKIKIPHRIMPGIYDLISGKVSISQLRKVEVEDLLRRKPVELDTRKIQAYIKNRRVLVTGAGGSIGSEIVRQITRYDPAHITLVGRGENSIFDIMRECEAHFPHIKTDVRICDVRDITSLQMVFNEIKPEVVFHAAAHKHVYLMEENPGQAVLNNIGGTSNVANLALEYHVKYFVNISTDKAVKPSSVMGASKRLAEYIVQQAAAKANSDQVFVSVRFGNVLGSRGSVVPIFRKQIEKGGPVTVTDPRMKRYFMTIPEASQLVLQAGALNINGAVFILDMGEPVLIVDMARDLIRLSGLEPDKDIKIVFTGMKPGEKLFEELMTDEEGTDLTQHAQITMARINGLPENFNSELKNLFDLAINGNKNDIRKAMFAMVSKKTEIGDLQL